MRAQQDAMQPGMKRTIGKRWSKESTGEGSTALGRVDTDVDKEND